MKKFEVKGHAPSVLPDGEWELVWADEFDGTELDRTKWDFRLSMMGKRHPAWTDKGVQLDGKSNAVFSVILEEGKPVSSQLQTGYNFMDEPVEKETMEVAEGVHDHIRWPIGKLKESMFTHSYGYYECRFKFQRKEGWWTAFWLQSPIIGCSLDPAVSGVEVDIMESFNPGKLIKHNVAKGGYGEDLMVARTGIGRERPELDVEEYHYIGLMWDETGYSFYVDGEFDGKVTEYLTARPEFIMLSTEVSGYRYEDHKPIEKAYEAVGDQFIVDHVRVFAKI